MTTNSKKELRKDMKLLLSNLDSRWIDKAQIELCSLLTSLLVSFHSRRFSFRNVLMWIPCFAGEPDLSGCVDDMLSVSSVYLPRIDRDNVMSFHRIFEDWRDHLELGARGVRQPVSDYGEVFVPKQDELNVVVIPGIAFSAEGKRLGRGGGHYDRYLGDERLAGAVKIGVCWSMQLTQDIPIDAHDVSMDWVCYERGALRVNDGEC